MIKSNELRIGNLVAFKRNTYSVWAITPASPPPHSQLSICGTEVKDLQYVREEDLEPAPLAEEWLHKFGVTWNNINGSEYYFTTTGLYGLRLDPPTKGKDDGWTPMTPDGDGSIGKEIFFVHQLQNLFFALTGEELTIKEPA